MCAGVYLGFSTLFLVCSKNLISGYLTLPFTLPLLPRVGYTVPWILDARRAKAFDDKLCVKIVGVNKAFLFDKFRSFVGVDKGKLCSSSHS